MNESTFETPQQDNTQDELDLPTAGDYDRPLNYVFEAAIGVALEGLNTEQFQAMTPMLRDFFMYGAVAALNTLREGMTFGDGTYAAFTMNELLAETEGDEDPDEAEFDGEDDENEEDYEDDENEDDEDDLE